MKEPFSFEVTLSPEKSKIMDFSQIEETNAHTPLKNIQVSNISESHLKLYINDKKAFKHIPKGAYFIEEDLRIRKLRIVNTDTSNTAIFFVTLDNNISQLEALKIIGGIKE